MKQFLVISLSLLFLNSCKDDEGGVQPVTLPSDVTITITKSSTEGLVDVSVKAVNQNYYTIVFEDGENSETERSNDGKGSHTYTKSGTYTIIGRAHLTEDQYTEVSDTVRIDLTPTSDTDGIPLKGYSTPTSYTGYTLAWNEEFDGTKLNEGCWNYELGTGSSGWGNNELQYYLKENTRVKNGYLSITAKKQGAGSSQYTSSRLTTQGKKSFKYGRVDIRAAMPAGQGMWPALWMLGESHASVGWPKCGEIDIMEMVGGTAAGKSDKKTHGTLHWDNNGDYASFGGFTLTSKTNLKEEFHVYSIIWDSQSIKWMLDNKLFHQMEITETHLTEFHEKFFFIFNVAVGGNWPGSPDANTEFPQAMHVDYVRVFQK